MSVNSLKYFIEMNLKMSEKFNEAANWLGICSAVFDILPIISIIIYTIC